MWAALLFPVAMVVANAQPAVPLPKDKPAVENPNFDYVKLTAEIRGTLYVDQDRIMVSVNQGGSSMMVYDDFWILEFGKDEALKASALKLKGKSVVLTGEPERPIGLPHKHGVGAKPGKPPRLVVHVKTIALAPVKAPQS